VHCSLTMAVVLRFKPGKATAPVFAYSVALLAKYNVKLVRASNEIPELVVPSKCVPGGCLETDVVLSLTVAPHWCCVGCAAVVSPRFVAT